MEVTIVHGKALVHENFAHVVTIIAADDIGIVGAHGFLPRGSERIVGLYP
jgi:hypothetical protein